jgi:hypothetical protein
MERCFPDVAEHISISAVVTRESHLSKIIDECGKMERGPSGREIKAPTREIQGIGSLEIIGMKGRVCKPLRLLSTKSDRVEFAPSSRGFLKVIC